uniref:deuterolysin n=1 Tax=Psilocybe cubensis TaxID=181762 RepID=A0A8H7XZZ9_PSICU
MLFKAYFSFISLIGFALATPVKQDVAISVDIQTTSTTLASSKDLELVATVTNNGAETVKVLKYGTILDGQLPTRSFIVTKDGNEVPFIGIKLSIALNQIDDSAFATLVPGKNVTVSHKVGALYDFVGAGAGKYTFTPVTKFLFDNSADKETFSTASRYLKAQVTSVNSVDVELQGEMAREIMALNTRAVDICTTEPDKSFINSSYIEAKALASMASAYVNSTGANDTLYTSYFGATPVTEVVTTLDAVAAEDSTNRTLSCVDTYDACTTSGLVAYTVIATTDIYLCPIFFDQVPSNDLCTGQTNVTARNAINTAFKLTHAVGNTVDIAYGCDADQELTDQDKVLNADNFNCFVTSIFADTEC